jgi:hypothetical protein
MAIVVLNNLFLLEWKKGNPQFYLVKWKYRYNVFTPNL